MANPVKDAVKSAVAVLFGPEALLEANRLIDAYRNELHGKGWNIKPRDLPTGCAILDADPRLQIQVYIAMHVARRFDYQLNSLKTILTARNLPWTAEDLELLLAHSQGKNYWQGDWESLLRLLQRYVAQGAPLTAAMETFLRRLAGKLEDAPGANIRKLQARLSALLGEDAAVLPDNGDVWAEAALADIAALPEGAATAWKQLLAHAQNSEGTRPSAAWLKQAEGHLAALGEVAFRAGIARWFPLATAPGMRTVVHESDGRTWENQQTTGSDRNISLLKGLAWICAGYKDTDVTRSIGKLVEGCLKKQPGVGPWAVRAAMAGVWALTEIGTPDAVGELGRLKTKVTFRTALNAIEGGLATAADRAGVSKADLEDLCVPAYGFSPDGVRRESFGSCGATATLMATGDIVVEWLGPGGKPVKSVPAAVKRDCPAELKAFKADVEAAGKMLSAQKARFESFYLPERLWTMKDWQDRFGVHPIMGHIAKRLIWHFSNPDGEDRAQGIWDGAAGAFVDSEGRPITWIADSTEVRLWHPIGFSVDAVLAWRDYLQTHNVLQPFKQAYREVYLLTEAELGTGTYSNRFAGHILKQHQMNSLAALRGWKNKLRLMVDDTYPPATREMPELGLRAEFWIEGIGDNYGTDTTESGSYLYPTTDQVRFYRISAPENYAHAGGGGYTEGYWGAGAEPAAPLPLTEVPALAFSEIMRDVDMFVGVCSVGNDPAWRDGGTHGQHHDYWTSYSFGDLSATAQTRHSVLSRLLPRLKIAERCTLTDRFLVVRGDLRTYKVHLGSGNILMEPNDQYLCIAQDRSAAHGETPVNFLPFEGDQRLSLILSKAFLLSNDAAISDPTITRQIRL